MELEIVQKTCKNTHDET